MNTPTSRDLYLRPALAETGEGRVDPAALVSAWAAETAALTTAAGDSAAAYRLLARWGALRRARPELIATLAAELDQLDRLLASPTGARLADLAHGRLTPEEWQGRASALADADLPDCTEQATALLRDLDEADLVADALRRLGRPDEEADAHLDRCAAWFWEHAWAFTGAGRYAQAAAATFRTDLESHDLFLAHSANKFVALLDVLEELASDATALPGGPVVPAGSVRFSDLLQPVGYAAAAAADVRAGLLAVEWLSPDGRFRAQMRFPAVPSPSFEVGGRPLNFERVSDGQPATELGGRYCRIGELVVTISAQAQAMFKVGDLRKAAGVLTVEGYPQPWTVSVGNEI